MATLIAAYNSDGCIGRCDAKCYNATCDHCDCICGGANHGVGLKQAIQNTEEMAEKWIEAYNEAHPEHKLEYEIRPKPIQLELF
jgi:predicted RNase H-like HicB family nuclease